MKCPNCGNLIESFNCKECGFDLKKSRLLSAVKFDASEISSMNEYIRVEDARIAKEEKRRADEVVRKAEEEKKRAEEVARHNVEIEKKRAAEEAARKAEEERKRVEEETRRKVEEEKKRAAEEVARKAEEERRREEEEARRKAEEEKRRAEVIAKHKAAEEEARRVETDRNRERIIADDNRRRKEQNAKAENERRIRNKKRVLFLEILALCVVVCAGVFAWKILHKTSYGTKGIEITTPKSINEFEKFGFYYDKEGSEFDCPWPEELGGLIDHIGMVMKSDTGCSLCFNDDFTRLLYILPESPAGMNMGVLTISNGKEESTVDLGNGYNVPAIALKNAYIIAQMMADNPSNPFLRCFPEEVAKAIEENNSTVILLQGPASETGEFDNTGHVYWGFNIESNDYKFYNAEHNQGRKKVVVGFYTGTEAESGLVGTSAEDVFGKAACDENSALGTLYSELFDKMSDEDNSFNPENMCIELNDETKESLVSILPYLNIQDTNNSAEIISSVERPKNNTDIVQVVKSGKATIYLYSDGSVQLYGEPDESCNYVSQWTEVKEICNTGKSVWGLKKDGSILKSSENEWEFDGWYDIIQITSGAGFGAGLSADGTVHLCGKYEWREIDTSSWTDIKKISAGFDYLVGLKNDGTVLYSGIGITDAFEGALRTWNDMEDICAGVVTAGKDDELIFGLQADGRVVVAGQPTYTKDYMTYDEEWDKDWNNIIQIAAGEEHIVALRNDGTVDYWAVIWEGKDQGQCDGIETWNNVERIFADGYFTIGLTKDGELLYAGSVTPVE